MTDISIARTLIRASRKERRRTMIERTEAHGDVPIMNLQPLEELDKSDWIWGTSLGIFIGLAFLFIVFAMSVVAFSRDLEGNYERMNPAMHAWFQNLRSQKGLCCSFADGRSIADVDWDTVCNQTNPNDCHYRVRLDGVWMEVPEAAVVTEPNRLGPAIVFPYNENGTSETKIRCFLPGASG